MYIYYKSFDRNILITFFFFSFNWRKKNLVKFENLVKETIGGGIMAEKLPLMLKKVRSKKDAKLILILQKLPAVEL